MIVWSGNRQWKDRLCPWNNWTFKLILITQTHSSQQYHRILFTQVGSGFSGLFEIEFVK